MLETWQYITITVFVGLACFELSELVHNIWQLLKIKLRGT